MFPDWSGSEGSKVVSRIKEFCPREPTVPLRPFPFLIPFLVREGYQGNRRFPETRWLYYYVKTLRILSIIADITLFSLLSIVYNLIGSHLLGTRFIPIKVSIVRLSAANIHSKCIASLHNLDNMTHHRHSVQTRLSVE